MAAKRILFREPRPWFCRHVSAAAGILGLLAIASTAHADATSGREAYERGDYQRAMEEWQAAADRNDPEAEFGVGTLYEFGAGDLRQDYKRAADWYQKAAIHGNTGAEYRLALLYSAGGDGFESDLVEAYKWASLAAQSKGVWGTLATDLVEQLEKVTTPKQQAEGIRRAADWTEARAPKREPLQQTTHATVEDRASKSTNTHCPGWPFPTLPCTDRFPALETQPQLHPNTSAQATPPSPRPSAAIQPTGAAASFDQLKYALRQINCAALRDRVSGRGSPVISGTVPDANQKAKLVQLVAHFFPGSQPEINVDIVPAPLCRSLSELNVLSLSGHLAEGSLGLRLNNGVSQLREGDPIKLEVRGPAYAVDLRIDYFSLDGQVLHLTPAGAEPTPRLAARATRLFGNTPTGEVWRTGGAPFGTELIAVIGASAPLDLGGSRPQVEAADGYLRDLKRALERGNPSTERPNVIATVLVTTSANATAQ